MLGQNRCGQLQCKIDIYLHARIGRAMSLSGRKFGPVIQMFRISHCCRIREQGAILLKRIYTGPGWIDLIEFGYWTSSEGTGTLISTFFYLA